MINQEDKIRGGKAGGLVLKLRREEAIKTHSKKCKKCDADIPYDKRRSNFCNKSCAASYNNIGVRRHAGTRPIPIKCGGCQEETYNEKYCSNKCQQVVEHKILLEKFNNGLVVHTQTQYKLLVELKGNVCEICGNNGQWFGRPLKLQVDHKDGNALNNFSINLRLLCPNCHNQTPNWGMRNKGRGRKSLGI
jgi:hypothetical protein